MNDLSPARLWLMRAAFLLLALTILFFQLLPLETTPRNWAGPDILLCFACAWSLRRPDFVPAALLAAAFLLSDLLLQRPPGLWAVLALIGCENLKTRGRSLRDANFAAEWATVGLIMLLVMLAYRLVLAVALVDLPSVTLSLTELGATILIYPLIVAVTRWVMRVRRPAPGELESLGQRL